MGRQNDVNWHDLYNKNQNIILGMAEFLMENDVCTFFVSTVRMKKIVRSKVKNVMMNI